ncbi:Uncharacterised protein [Mycobacteroides abscessus subsp. abscessus]|nr:Uncharacterised protein [Mycobacteroides abscessus subsp. abscessus]
MQQAVLRASAAGFALGGGGVHCEVEDAQESAEVYRVEPRIRVDRLGVHRVRRPDVPPIGHRQRPETGAEFCGTSASDVATGHRDAARGDGRAGEFATRGVRHVGESAERDLGIEGDLRRGLQRSRQAVLAARGSAEIGEKRPDQHYDDDTDADDECATGAECAALVAARRSCATPVGCLVNSRTRHWRYSVIYRAHGGKPT